MKQPSAAVLEARRRFAMHFKRAVLERIEAQHAERAARSPAELNAERDALIVSLASEGRSLAEIINASEAKGQRVRALLGMPPAPPQPPPPRRRTQGEQSAAR